MSARNPLLYSTAGFLNRYSPQKSNVENFKKVDWILENWNNEKKSKHTRFVKYLFFATNYVTLGKTFLSGVSCWICGIKGLRLGQKFSNCFNVWEPAVRILFFIYHIFVVEYHVYGILRLSDKLGEIVQ